MPDRAGQTHNACKPDHFHSREDSQAGDAGDSITLDLCRSQPGTRSKIYQASNWLFVGETGHEAGITLKGKLTHRRTINSKSEPAILNGCESGLIQAQRDMKAKRN